MSQYFADIAPVTFEGADSTNPLAYRHYNAPEKLGDKTMADHLRFAVCYWHNFVWEGNDPFGGQTFQRPWFPAPLTCSAFWMCRSFAFTIMMCAPKATVWPKATSA